MKRNTLDSVLKVGVWIGLLLTAFLPIVVTSSLFFPFIAGKGFAFRILAEIVFVLWFVLAIRVPVYRPRFSFIMAAILSFVGIIFLADVFGANPFKSFWSNFERMEGFFLLLHLLGFFVVAGSMFTAQGFKWFMHAAIGVGLFSSMYGILQLSGELVINQGGVRVDATLGNATYFAVMLLFLTFFTLISWLKREENSYKLISGSFVIGFILMILFPWQRLFTSLGGPWSARMKYIGENWDNISVITGDANQWLMWISILGGSALIYAIFSKRLPSSVKKWLSHALYGLATLTFVWMLLSTATRGVVLGLIGGFIVSASLLALFGEKGTIGKKLAAGALVALIVLVSGFIVLKDSDYVRNHPVLGRFSSISVEEGSTRFMVWGIAWEGFKERPILGWGQENFNFVFNKYYNPNMYNQEPWFDRTHNVVFDWLIAGGIFGLIAYLSLHASVLYELWILKKEGSWWNRIKQMFSSNGFSVAEASLITGLIAAYFFQNLFVFDNLIGYLFFFAILAYVHNIRSRESERAENFFEVLRRSDRNFALAIAGMIFVLTMGLYFVSYKGIATGRWLIIGLSPQQEGLNKNLQAFERALSYGTTGRQEVAEQLIMINSRFASMNIPAEVRTKFGDLAVIAIDKELDRNPSDARLWMFKGSLMSERNDPDKATEAFERARELTPTKQTPLISLGTAALQKGDTEKALSYLKEAYELAPAFPEAKYLYAISAVYAKQFPLADSLLKDENGEYKNIDNRITQAYASVSRYDLLIPIIQSALKRSPDSAELHIALAVAYLNTGRRNDAIAELEIVKKLRPNSKDQFDFYISEIKAGRNP